MSMYIVSTPIGNLADITIRAVETLRSVDIVLAEDTRRTGLLLKHFDMHKQMSSFNEHNCRHKTKFVVEELKKGKDIALVSDSGTPGISDPGFYLARECAANNINIIPVPGPTAFVSALVCSGLPTDRFTFYGFLPKKEGKKKELLEEIKKRNETAILYESPYRLLNDLEIIGKIMPSHQIVIARELTKKFEEFIRGTASDILKKIGNKEVKGEIVLIIGKS